MPPAVPNAAAAAQERLLAQLRQDPAFADFWPWAQVHRSDRLLDAAWTAGCRSPQAHRQNPDGSPAKGHRQVVICLDPQEQLVVVETWVEGAATFARLNEYGENVQRAVIGAEAASREMRRTHPAFRDTQRDDQFRFDAGGLRLALNERRARRIVPIVIEVRRTPALLANLLLSGLRPDELRAVRMLITGPGESRADFLARVQTDLVAGLAEALLIEGEAADLRRAAAERASRPAPGENVDG